MEQYMILMYKYTHVQLTNAKAEFQSMNARCRIFTTYERKSGISTRKDGIALQSTTQKQNYVTLIHCTNEKNELQLWNAKSKTLTYERKNKNRITTCEQKTGRISPRMLKQK